MRTLLRLLCPCSLLVPLVFAACGPRLPAPRPMPQGITLAGVWDSNWGQMTLRQSGVQVHGRYSGFRNGSISGTVEGDLLRFSWTQEESRQFGRGFLQITPTGQAMEGRWGYGQDRFGGGRWWARRVDTR